MGGVYHALFLARRDLKVLIVDDNYTNRKVLSGTLVRWGMKPVDEGAAALPAPEIAKSASAPFSLILLDRQMPEMNGFMLMERIQREPELVGASVMTLTSAGHLGDAARRRTLGISAYLRKPVRQALCNVPEKPAAGESCVGRASHTAEEQKAGTNLAGGG